MTRRTLARGPALAVALVAGLACNQRQQGRTPRLPELTAPTGAGGAVLMTMGFRHVQSSGRELSATTSGIPGRRAGGSTGERVAAGLGLSAAAAAALDLDRPAWMFTVDAGPGDAGVLIVVAVADRAALERALVPQYEGTEAGMARLRAADGTLRLVGLAGDRMIIADRAASFAAGGAYALGTLAGAVPSADVELRVHVDRLVARSGQTVEQLLESLLAQAPGAMSAAGAPTPASTPDLLARLGPRAELLAGLREIILTANLSARELRAELAWIGAGEAPVAGPGDPIGADRIPATAWLVLTDRADAGPATPAPAAAAAGEPPSGVLARLIGDAAGPADLSALGDDVTLAVHPGAVGTATTVALVLRPPDVDRATATIDTLGRLLFAKLAPGAPVTAQDRRLAGHAARVLSAPLPGGGGTGAALAHLVGGVPELVMVRDGELLLVTFGGVAAADMERMLAPPGGPRAPSLLARRELAAAAGFDREGTALIAIAEAARSLGDAAPMELKPMLAPLYAVRAGNAAQLSWGVDRRRGARMWRLALPVGQVADLLTALLPAGAALGRRGP